MTIEEQLALLRELSRLCEELDLDFTSRATARAAVKLKRVCDLLCFNLKQRELAEQSH